jgi:hypothetical protein
MRFSGPSLDLNVIKSRDMESLQGRNPGRGIKKPLILHCMGATGERGRDYKEGEAHVFLRASALPQISCPSCISVLLALAL